VTSMIAGVDIGGSADVYQGIIFSFGRILLTMAPAVALAFMLSLVARSIAAGIAVSIGIGFLEPAIFGLLGALSDVFHTIEKFGMAWGASQLLSIGYSDSTTTTEAWQGAAACVIYTVIFVTISYVVFRRRDVTSG